ncbi:MAG: hypothetical protein ACJ78L_12865 [Chloroflexota bacterium]
MVERSGPAPAVTDATDAAVPWAAPSTDRPEDIDGAGVEAVALWSPGGIGIASFLLGFPGGLVLAALNWQRMGRPAKAIVHVIAGIAAMWALVFTPTLASAGLVIGIVVAFYLYRVQRTDQAALLAAGRVTERNGLLGVVIAIVATIGIIASGVVLATAVGVSAVEHRGSVLFSTTTPTDACIPPPTVSTFAPSDSIYSVAIMRETVRAGSHVTYQLEGPDAIAGPFPVSAAPPFDCINTQDSLGPLGPGTYVFRYRYGDQTTSADLATGTFTVMAGSSASPGVALASSPASAAAASIPAGSATPSRSSATCIDPTSGVFPHQAPEIEALLPATVGRRPLARWSVRGRCWLELAVDTPAHADALVAGFTTADNPDPVDDAKLVYGVAGRSDTSNDPPYFIWAAGRPENEDEIGLVLTLLFGSAGFHDVDAAIDLNNYQKTAFADKDVYVGTTDMLDQNVHQKGRPYLYQTADHMFVLIADDAAWAEEAIGSLP